MKLFPVQTIWLSIIVTNQIAVVKYFYSEQIILADFLLSLLKILPVENFVSFLSKTSLMLLEKEYVFLTNVIKL